MNRQTPVGKTKDQGWEIGVRRTFPISADRAWELLMTQPGLSLWLGDDPDLKLEKDATFQTADRTTGHIVSLHEGSLLRMRWQPRDWAEPSTLQLRVIPAGNKATISFHHDRLVDATQRAQMQKHWSAVLGGLSELIESS
jgi:uncharacterized protein YndB with AHSA1/START domain